jgi:hypothetical protein
MPAVAFCAVLCVSLLAADGPPPVPDAEQTPPKDQAVQAAAAFWKAAREGRLTEMERLSAVPWAYYGDVVAKDRKLLRRLLADHLDGTAALAEICPDMVEVQRWEALRRRNPGWAACSGLDGVLAPDDFCVRIGQAAPLDKGCDWVLVRMGVGGPKVVGLSH